MSWTYKVTLTIDHTQCGANDSLGFPVLVSLSNALLKTVANSGQINNTGTQSGGVSVTMPLDLIFTSDSGGSTKIPWEVESYTASTGVLLAWVKVGTVSHSADTLFYCFFGDAAVNSQQNTSTLAPSAVWDSNFMGVWHLPDGSSLSTVDSTTNANNGSSVTATAATGKVDGGAAFANQNITIGNTGSTSISDNLTIAFWLKIISTNNSYEGILAKRGASTANYGINYSSLAGFPSNDAFQLYFQNVGYKIVSAQFSTNFSTGTWYYITGTFAKNGGNTDMILYKNGSSLATNSANANLVSSTDSLAFGNSSSAGESASNMVLDEVRISNIARSVDWILTEYNNQFAPNTFLSASFASLTSGRLFTNSNLDGLGGGGQLAFNRVQ